MTYYHLAELIHVRALKYKSKTALKYRDKKEKKWKSISWRKFSSLITKTACSMVESGVNEQDRVGVYSQNMPQYLMVDFAAFANRAIPVPIYATSSHPQVKYIVEDAQIEVLFVGEQFQYNNAYKVQQESKTLKRIVVFDSNVKFHPEDTTSIHFDNYIAIGENSESEVKVKVRTRSVKEDDVACILYTSGTTGEPKGVVLPHSSYMEVFRIHDARLTNTSSKDVSMNFLPLAHVFEKAWSYFALHKGMTVVINQDPKEIQKSIKQVAPTIMCSVPRFWEKVYSGVYEKISSSKGIMKWLYNDAIKTGKKHNLDYKNNMLTPPLGTRIKFFLYDKTIFNILKYIIGIHKGRMFPCAGAPLSIPINEFLQSVNIPIVIGYGLTETNATVSFYPPTRFTLDSVGLIMPNLEVKIGENNEILVKGKTVMKEYYKKPAETAAAFTEDGFFRTGDAGVLSSTNILKLTDRIKDLYKTANGKYIAPQAIETILATDKYIDMIIVIGDQRKYVSALIVPDYDAILAWAREQNIKFDSIDELLKKKEINNFYYSRIEPLQANFASFEKIKYFTLLPEPFTMENGELTNTLKLKRKIIIEKYNGIIDAMYNE